MRRQKYSRVINRKGFVLLASVVMTVFLGIMIGVAFRGMYMQLQESASRELSQDAFNTAESGLEQAVFMFRQSSQWNPVPPLQDQVLIDPALPASGVNLQGTYTVSVSPAPDYNGWPSVWVKSIGVDRFGGTPRTILAQVLVKSPARFLIFTLGNLTVRSGANFTNGLLARDIDLQVDTSLPIGSPERNINVIGQVSYMRNLNSNVNLGDPLQGVSISEGTQLTQAITFTGIDQTYYRQLADPAVGGRFFNSSQTISGPISRQTMGATNGVVFVEGDIHISGTFSDSMTFVATGNIYIDDNLTSGATPDPKPQLGLLAAKNVVIPAAAPSSISIEAFVLADGGTFSADKTTTKGTLNFTGAMAVRGDSGSTAIDLNAYTTRNYHYNSSFMNNTIPSLMSIANVVAWGEVDPSTPFPNP